MTRPHYSWHFPGPVPENINAELDSFTLPFRSILYNRGCETMQDALAFLLPQKPNYPQAQTLRHLDTACKLIKNAIKSNQIIAIYGDYDTDGITATAILTLALQKISSQVIPFIPNRIHDGYGLNNSAIDYLHQQGAELLLTVDNGIRSTAETAHAKSLGMDVIISDHHQPATNLPDADAIINPKLPGDPYPNKHLAGVGVAYKLICALSKFFPQIMPDDYLDLVALGTIADIVPLVGENRYLVKQGLNQINGRPRQSIFSLIGAAGLRGRIVSASDISFQIAPRINSSGRLADSEDHLLPLNLLLSSDKIVCGELSQKIDDHNNKRKNISKNMLERIESEFATSESLPNILISLDPANKIGIAGIAAGSLTQNFYLPSIVGEVGEETTTASCRSIPEFDMISALSENRDLFKHFGGHKLAAGFTIENENLPELRRRMLSIADRELSGLAISPSLKIDAVVSLSDLDQALHQEVLKLEPTGEGNPTPLFAIHNLSAVQTKRVGRDKEHLKLTVSDEKSSMSAIAFGMGSLKGSLPNKFSLAAYFSENEFRGIKEYQLRIEDFLPSD